MAAIRDRGTGASVDGSVNSTVLSCATRVMMMIIIIMIMVFWGHVLQSPVVGRLVQSERRNPRNAWNADAIPS